MANWNAEVLLENQKQYFESGHTRAYTFRMQMLAKLRRALKQNEQAFLDALFADLHKSAGEAFMTEIGVLYDEISYHEKHLRGWMQEKSVHTPLSLSPAKSRILPEPYGSVLIISPWNYPLQLCFAPLIGAISAGNCAVIKTSELAPHTAKVVVSVIAQTFDPAYITAVEGSVDETTALLQEPFDYIFFTGSPRVGKIVMKYAAEHLSPLTLELGGKSPVIVDETANIKLAARRIVFGKFLNAGQICVAPDYLLIAESVRDAFVREFRAAVKRFSPDGRFTQMCHIINRQHFSRICGYLQDGEIIAGGKTDEDNLFMSPTLLSNVKPDAPIMQEELFAPILPMMTYSSLEDAIAYIKTKPKPLALYVFSQNRKHISLIHEKCSFGGGCVNDVILHVASNRMSFGGVGNSGMGQYHGKASFDLFTHNRSVLFSSSKLDIPMRYPPFTPAKDFLVRMFMK